jgi:hypothetical protein
VLDTETSKKNAIATLVSDVVLLLTMLVGLLRLRQDGTMFGFGKLLWRQVGGAHLALTDLLYVSHVKGSHLALLGDRRGGSPGCQSDRSLCSDVLD